MPFIERDFIVSSPTKAICFLIHSLHYSPSVAQKIIDKGRLRVFNKPAKKTQILYGKVSLSVFESTFYSPNELVLPLLDSRDFALFNKPANLLTHPKGRFIHKSLLDSIRYHCSSNAQPIHRLDFETSGLILVGKGKENERALKNIFMQEGKSMPKKTYIAEVYGHINGPREICTPILTSIQAEKSKKNLSIRSMIDKRGKKAVTIVLPIFYMKNSTFVCLKPLSGRTHQIRLHLAHIGHPIINDFLYGCEDNISERYLVEKNALLNDENMNNNTLSTFKYANKILHLHASTLDFSLKGVRYFFSSPMPSWVNINIKHLP